MSVLTRTVEVAAGVFAPGHLGELTQHIPFELVDDVLERTGCTERRLRRLPSRVGVYFVLALTLFPALGYRRVWSKLVTGLGAIAGASPSEKALRDLRRRVGAAPLKLLFETLAGPVARPATPGTCYRRWRTVALDGCCSIKAPDQPRVIGWLGKVLRPNGFDGYPMLRLMVLCETGTRALLGACFGPTDRGERHYAQSLLNLLDAGMLLLADRGFDSDDFLAQVIDTQAHLLIRLNARRTPAVLARLPDGSFLTRIGGRRLRIINATITVTCASGQSFTDRYRLATTLLDHRSDPAASLIKLYHERWEVESAFYALRHTLLDGLVLRSQDPFGITQKLWAQLTVYQALRRAMFEATDTVCGIDPDRASFTTAREAARDQLITAQGILPDSPGSGALTQTILASLLPQRRTHTSARKIKAFTSRYRGNPADPRPATSRNITHLAITITEPPPDTVVSLGANGPGRRDRTVRLLRTDNDRDWSIPEIAKTLGINHYRSLCAQLGHWVKEGVLHRTTRGLYRLTPTWQTPQTIKDLPTPSTA
jgi:hypothetical protein